AFLPVAADDAQDVLANRASLALLLRGDDQVGPEEGALEAVRLPHAELIQDVDRDAPGGGRRERQHRDVPELLLEAAKLPVRGPEIMAPVADAVRFVHDHERDGAALEQPADRTFEPLRRALH